MLTINILQFLSGVLSTIFCDSFESSQRQHKEVSGKEVELSIANPWGSPWGNSSGSMWVSVFNRVPNRLNRSYGWPQKINNLVTGEKFALVVSTRKHY